MLELRPNCEYCDKDLPPQAMDARICTYECTFCADCVDKELHNVCPNCGGGFAPRPIRPSTARRKNLCVAQNPGSENRRNLSYTKDEVRAFVAEVKDIAPEAR